jgi:pimeloyl-ACP methyl ester carboxylesterase/DNA-binding XRE family transcriptional regulator
MDEIVSFGAWVQQRRKALDLTQADLAKHIGCAVITIKKIEQDERRPSREIAELLAKHLLIPSPERDAFLRRARGQFVSLSSSSASRHKEQQVRFCTTPDGARIAYATVGTGPVLVKAANWLSHLEYDWNSPVWRHWLAGLSERHTLVRYDERGCGLSDWDVDTFSLDAWVSDLETVVDTLGLERFPLLGISQGGSVAITYAVRHPERVSHLILYGGYARGRWKLALSPQQREETEMLLTLTKLGWGRSNPAFRQVFTSLFIPDATTEQMRWFNELQRMSTSPENAVKFLRAFYEIDVSHLAPMVTVPTMVLHAREDGRIPFDAGRELAASIPGARFVTLEGKNHILLESEPAWPRFLAEVHHFLESKEGDKPPSSRHGATEFRPQGGDGATPAF